jgi:predicted nucleic acid-binding OB-fold protein
MYMEQQEQRCILILIFLRSSYEEGTPHCRFQRKPVALGAGRVQLSVIEITLLTYRIEPPLEFHIGQIAELFLSPKERL